LILLKVIKLLDYENLKREKLKIPAAGRRALLTDRREMRKNCEADLFVRAGNLAFLCFASLFAKHKYAKI